MSNHSGEKGSSHWKHILKRTEVCTQCSHICILHLITVRNMLTQCGICAKPRMCILWLLDISVAFRAFGGLSFKISPQNNNKFCVVFLGVFSLPTKAIPPPPPNCISRKKTCLKPMRTGCQFLYDGVSTLILVLRTQPRKAGQYKKRFRSGYWWYVHNFTI